MRIAVFGKGVGQHQRAVIDFKMSVHQAAVFGRAAIMLYSAEGRFVEIDRLGGAYDGQVRNDTVNQIGQGTCLTSLWMPTLCQCADKNMAAATGQNGRYRYVAGTKKPEPLARLRLNFGS